MIETQLLILMKKIATFIILTTFSFNIMAQQKIVQTAGRTQLGEFAPEFAHLNDDILFGEVWSRNDLLSLRDRSLVTITSLISQGITDNSLKYHLQSDVAGIRRKESLCRKYTIYERTPKISVAIFTTFEKMHNFYHYS